jgi:hypothetical protein
MTAEQHIADAIAVTDYLRERFHRHKIYVLGLLGSFVGIQVAACTARSSSRISRE